MLIVLVNGNHLAADNTFIEKRRRGLVRFANALVRHPILSQEQLVIIFLTVPTVSLLGRQLIGSTFAKAKFANSIRSLPYGENKQQFLFKKSFLESLYPLDSRILYHRP